MKLLNLLVVSGVGVIFILFLLLFCYSLQHPSQELMKKGNCTRSGGKWVVVGSHMEKVSYKNFYYKVDDYACQK